MSVAPLILDVRTSAEFAPGHVAGAKNISTPRPPLSERNVQALRERLRLARLPRARPILVYCARGVRAGIAAELLRDLGYDARNIGGTWAEPLASMLRRGDLRWTGEYPIEPR